MPAAYDITHRYMAVSAYERHGAKKGHALLATALPTLVPQVGAPAGVGDRVPSLRSMFRFVASWRSRASLSQLDRPGRGGKWTSEDKRLFRLWALGTVKVSIAQAGEAAYLITGHPQSRSRVSAVLAKHGITRKKRTLIDPRRDENEVQLFYAKLRHWGITAEQLVSVDEVGLRGSELVDKYGWAERGSRAIDYDVPENSGPRYEGIVAIAQDGLIAIEFYTGGSVQWNNVADFCAEELFPVMNPWPMKRSVAIVDNASMHHTNQDELSRAAAVLGIRVPVLASVNSHAPFLLLLTLGSF